MRKTKSQKKNLENFCLGIEMATDFPSTFEEQSCLKMVGYDMTSTASKRLFENSGLKATDVDVIELHDCFSANELITYEALGLCAPGEVILHLILAPGNI